MFAFGTLQKNSSFENFIGEGVCVCLCATFHLVFENYFDAKPRFK